MSQMIMFQRALDADRGRGHAGGRGRPFPLVPADLPQVGRDRRPEVTDPRNMDNASSEQDT